MTTSALYILRRAAIVRELASLGLYQEQIAILLDVDPTSVIYIIRRFGIDVQARGRSGGRPWLRSRILRDFGKDGVTPSVMAERYGTTRNSVGVTIHKLRSEGLLPPSKRGKVRPVNEAHP